jgi:hypothetical protein
MIKPKSMRYLKWNLQAKFGGVKANNEGGGVKYTGFCLQQINIEGSP